MDQKQMATVAADMKRFFDYARELGKTAYRRINQASKLQEFMDLSIELREKISRAAGQSREADRAFADRCSAIIDACAIMSVIMDKQKELAANLLVIEGLDPRAEKRLMFRILMMSESLQNGMAIVRQVLMRAQAALLIDRRIGALLMSAEGRQQDMRDAVKRLQEFVTGDWRGYCVNEKEKEAEEALHGRINAIINSGDVAGMKTMLADVLAELDAEEALSASLAVQSETAADLSRAARDLLINAGCIRKLNEEKGALARKEPGDGARLSVILSLEIADYMKMRETFGRVQTGEGMSDEARGLYMEMLSLFDIAGELIEELADLNRSSLELSDSDVRRDDQIMELSNMCRHCHDSISKESDAAEKLLSEVSDGSHRNLIIGQVLGKNISKILESYGC